MAGMTWFDDYTIMRPLVMDFPGDKGVENVGDQYMFGPAFMVCPVYTYQARNRKVYFPKGTNWYNFYTGKMIQGGQSLIVDAPYERMPLFVHEGSIIPVGPALQYSNEKLPKKIVLYVYRGQDGHFTLYEDEGVNYDYEKGAYSNIPFSYNDAKGTLTIGERKGQYKGMLKERTFVVVPVGKENPKAFDPDAKGIEVKYDGHSETIQL
jgi:alpha-D-xyloside xylohydrolase